MAEIEIKKRASILKNEFIDLSKWLTSASESEQEAALKAFVEGFKLYERMVNAKLEESDWGIDKVQTDFSNQYRAAANDYIAVDLAKANGTTMLSVFLECIALGNIEEATFVKKSGFELLEKSTKVVNDIDSPFTEDN